MANCLIQHRSSALVQVLIFRCAYSCHCVPYFPSVSFISCETLCLTFRTSEDAVWLDPSLGGWDPIEYTLLRRGTDNMHNAVRAYESETPRWQEFMTLCITAANKSSVSVAYRSVGPAGPIRSLESSWTRDRLFDPHHSSLLQLLRLERLTHQADKIINRSRSPKPFRIRVSAGKILSNTPSFATSTVSFHVGSPVAPCAENRELSATNELKLQLLTQAESSYRSC
ncbi:hypothetical protein BDW74DRAFT_83456 [Aspergillus multicolor]|uniref:uncharacterized protein n=1 Tax=Aspergillus multicolor TaxID=41759 RepID=UPI003CCCA20C